MKLLVTGAGGFLGREFCSAATAAGHGVVAVIRSTSDQSRLEAEVIVKRDIMELSADDVPEGLDAVVHFATGTSGSVEAMVQVAVEGTRRVIAVARVASVPRFVHVSSMSVHRGPVVVDPRAVGGYVLEPRPELRGAYALAKVRAEHAVVAEADPSMEIVLCRPGLVFGRDMVDVLAGTAVRLPLGVAVGFGKPGQGVPWLDVDDLNAALLGILGSPPQPGLSAYEILSDPVPTKRELVAVVERHTGLPRRTLWLPEFVPTAAAMAVDALRRDRSGRTRYAVRRAWRFDPAALDSAPAWRRAGTEPAVTIAESVRRAVTIDPALDGPLDETVQTRAAAVLRVASNPREVGRDSRVVIVGAGRITQEMHIPAIESIAGLTVSAVVDPQEGLAAMVADRFGARAFRRLADVPDELIAGAAVAIATPGATHVELAEQALARGGSAILEKPAALQLDDFERLCSLETPELPISVFHNYRLRSATLELWDFLLRHDVGPLVRARLRFLSPPLKLERARWMRDEQRHRVLVNELAIHFIDVLVLVSGELSEVHDSRRRLSSDRLRTISFAAFASSGLCEDIFIDLDLAGTAPGARIYLEFARTACAVDFFPDGFRVFSPKANPLDDVGAGLARLAGAVRQRARSDRAVLRAVPHRLIYEEHLRRASGGGGDSVFGLGGVADTMRSLAILGSSLYEGGTRPVAS